MGSGDVPGRFSYFFLEFVGEVGLRERAARAAPRVVECSLWAVTTRSKPFVANRLAIPVDAPVTRASGRDEVFMASARSSLSSVGPDGLRGFAAWVGPSRWRPRARRG